MVRLSVLAWVILTLVMVIVLFNVKAQVEHYNRELIRVNRAITEEQEKIRVLKTEWSYLDHPDRIADLARIHLGYDTEQRPQIGQMMDLPARAINREAMTSVLKINVATEPMNRLGPQLNAEVLELDSEIGGLRHIASPDTLGDLINDLTD